MLVVFSIAEQMSKSKGFVTYSKKNSEPCIPKRYPFKIFFDNSIMGFAYGLACLVTIVHDSSRGLTIQEILEINRREYGSSFLIEHSSFFDPDKSVMGSAFLLKKGDRFYLREDVDAKSLDKQLQLARKGKDDYYPR